MECRKTTLCSEQLSVGLSGVSTKEKSPRVIEKSIPMREMRDCDGTRLTTMLMAEHHITLLIRLGSTDEIW